MRFKIIVLILSILVLLFSIELVNGETSYTYNQNTDVDLKISCFDENNTVCDASTECFITIFYPDSTTLINNQSMTKQTTFYNYSLNTSQTSLLGTYSTVAYCSGTTKGYSVFQYEIIDPNLASVDTGSGIFYIGLLFLLIIIFGFIIYGLVKSENPIVKLSCLLGGYIFLAIIMFTLWQIAGIYLTSTPFIEKFAMIMFRVLMAGMLPLVVGLIVWLIYQAITVKEIRSLMERGIPEDEAKARVKKKKW